MFAHTIRLQKRAHTEGSKRGKSSPQPRSADPSLREETRGERGGKTTPQLQISSLLADLPRPIISPLRLRALLQRLDLLSNLGLSPPAVSAPAAVRLLCSLDRAERGGTDPCRGGGGWCWCWCCACCSVRGSRSQVERRASAGDAGSSQSGDRSPKMAHRCGATRLGRTRGENSLNAVRVWLWCVFICKHVTCATPDLPPSPLPPPSPPPPPSPLDHQLWKLSCKML